MKNITTIALISVLVGVMSTANAVITRGSPTCGSWVSNRQKDDGEKRINNKWLIGYLSGIAAAKNEDFIVGTDNESLFIWMDNYCSSNPLKIVGDGGIELYLELLKQKGLN